MKKKFLLGVVSTAFLLFLGCKKNDDLLKKESSNFSSSGDSNSLTHDYCGEYTETRMLSGNPNNPSQTGIMRISNDNVNIYGNFNADAGWVITNYYVYIGHPDSIPLTGAGLPQIENFHLKGSVSNLTSIQISRAATYLEDVIVVARLDLKETSGTSTREAWNEGTRYRTNSLPSYSNYEIQECPSITCDFNTYGQGGWGSEPKGKNVGTILESLNISDIKIGWGGNTIMLSNAEAIRNFLPQSNPPSAIEGAHINPNVRMTVLAGQILALELNVKLNPSLGDLTISSGNLSGKRVSEALVLANKILGGEYATFSPSEINEVISKINENFGDGENNGFLNCN
jgi:hypothetical protein